VAGLELDASRLRRGIAAGQVADAGCAIAAAEETLARFERSGDALVERPAAQARRAILLASMAEARAIVERVRAATERGLATVEELQAAELRLSRLSAAAADAEGLLAELQAPPPTDRVALQRGISDLTAARLRLHDAQGELRAAGAISLTVRAGVDRVLEDARDPGFPAFGLVTLTLVPGGLWQPAAEASAAQGLSAWSATSAGEPADRVAARLASLRARGGVERGKLAEARVLLADLERRHEELRGMPGERVLAFRDALFFDLALARAEVAALEAGLRALDGFLGEG
jgi:hypothetical protein